MLKVLRYNLGKWKIVRISTTNLNKKDMKRDLFRYNRDFKIRKMEGKK